MYEFVFAQTFVCKVTCSKGYFRVFLPKLLKRINYKELTTIVYGRKGTSNVFLCKFHKRSPHVAVYVVQIFSLLRVPFLDYLKYVNAHVLLEEETYNASVVSYVTRVLLKQ